jgi:hypothetical protein
MSIGREGREINKSHICKSHEIIEGYSKKAYEKTFGTHSFRIGGATALEAGRIDQKQYNS